MTKTLALTALLLVLPMLGGCEIFHPVTPEQATQLMNNPYSADARREGIAALATRWSFTHFPPYTTRYKDIAQHDPDFIVRAMAIRALNISRDKSATKIFIAALNDLNAPVRLEAAKALANLPDPDAAAPLLSHLQRFVIVGDASIAENRDVRIAAADALRHYHTLDVEHALVGYLDAPEFGIAWQSRQSLIALTGKDLRYDKNAWLQFLVGPHGPVG